MDCKRGGGLSKLEKLSIQSYLDNGHEFHLYIYDDVEGIPEGVVVKDGNEVLDQSNVYKDRRGSYAAFSDWFRYEMLAKKSGFWVDTDTVCIRPFSFEEKFIVGKEDAEHVCGAVLGFPKDHGVVFSMLNACREFPKIKPWDNKKEQRLKILNGLFRLGRKHAGFGAMGGPKVLTRVLHHFDLFREAKPFTYFYPIYPKNWDSIFDSTFAGGIGMFENTYCIHLWNEMHRRKGMDKNATFASDSLFEQLKRKHHIK